MDELRSAAILSRSWSVVAGVTYAVLAGCRQAWKDWKDEPEHFRREPGADPNPSPPSTYLRPYLSAENYRSLVVDHCQLVEQFENLVVVVIQLWEMNNTLRERLDLPRQPLPIAASLACATQTAAREPLSATESTTDPSGASANGAQQHAEA